MSEAIRYVHIHQGEYLIEESFIDFIESHQKSGVGLASEITEKLESDGLNLEDCWGQGYDNGSNMSEKYNGVQAVITNLNQLATYIPCAAHTLNLVGLDSAEVSPEMVTFFGRAQNTFFSSSTLRWEKLMKK